MFSKKVYGKIYRSDNRFRMHNRYNTNELSLRYTFTDTSGSEPTTFIFLEMVSDPRHHKLMNARFPLITTLVDGYNLMLGSVVSPDARAKRNLHDSRHYFLRWLESKLEPDQKSSVCVVFDTSRTSQQDQHSMFHGIRIVYSTSHISADECIQQIIREHTSPQKLTVVSSDHQIQRTANARGAISIDSEVWIESLNTPKHRGIQSGVKEDNIQEKPDGKIDIQKWLDEFGY